MNAVFNLFRVLFAVFLAAFLLGGLAIVVIQFFGIVTLSESTVTGVNTVLAPVTFVASTACALCAFVLRYSSQVKNSSGEE